MRNSVFTMLLSAMVTISFAQIKVIAPNGDTGIGMDSPTEKLEVDGNFSITAGQQILSYLNDGVTKASLFRMDAGNNMVLNQSASTSFGSNNSGVTAVISGSKDFTVTGTSGSIMKVKGSSGNVGIGYFNASEKLSVNGNILYSGALIVSDRRLKNNVVEFDDGLSTVLKMKPIKYNYNGKAGLDPSAKHIGVYAQDLQEIAPYLVKDWVYEEANSEDQVIASETYLKIDDTSIKYLLVNAIQEQQEMIKTLQDQVKELSTMIVSQQSISKEIQSVDLDAVDGNFLGQNRPNPFDAQTIIDYKVGANAQNASMLFFDVQGNKLKEVNLDINATTLEVNALNLPSGIYSYQLSVDNKIVSAQKMVISK